MVTAGGIPETRGSVDAPVEAIANQDLTETLTAIATTIEAGVDPKDLGARYQKTMDAFRWAGVTWAGLAKRNSQHLPI